MSEQFTPDLNLKGLPDAIRERLYSGKKKDFCYQGIWIFFWFSRFRKNIVINGICKTNA